MSSFCLNGYSNKILGYDILYEFENELKMKPIGKLIITIMSAFICIIIYSSSSYLFSWVSSTYKYK